MVQQPGADSSSNEGGVFKRIRCLICMQSIAGSRQSQDLTFCHAVASFACKSFDMVPAAAQVVFRIGLSKKGHPQVIQVKSIVGASVSSRCTQSVPLYILKLARCHADSKKMC